MCTCAMLEPLIYQLSEHHIVLASGSPRRKEILQRIDFPFEVLPSTFEENLNSNDFSSPAEFVTETAKRKAIEVEERLLREGKKPALIIGADTIVTLNKEIFGKPKDEADAFRMLEKLSDKTHEVISGVALVLPNKVGDTSDRKIISFHQKTCVAMCAMSSNTIKAYIRTKEPLDKAGGYAIQGKGGSFIKTIHGDYYNVVGFPLHRFCTEIQQLCDQGVL